MASLMTVNVVKTYLLAQLVILIVVVMLILGILPSLHLAVRVLSWVEKDSSFLEACKTRTL